MSRTPGSETHRALNRDFIPITTSHLTPSQITNHNTGIQNPPLPLSLPST
ncbi:hypothetical protein BofuT4_uP002000.1 [Botrytis cinerea T4]|uniref:Uncharacterized protein n=1 Tax=Botryotinia fuckeliana (strain T4) TaxID=999810 RepID=G2YMA5_BOTF4|nr:hypothetical protein BofuT4_uP002000.1 [Botrytis cinerea T4]